MRINQVFAGSYGQHERPKQEKGEKQKKALEKPDLLVSRDILAVSPVYLELNQTQNEIDFIKDYLSNIIRSNRKDEIKRLLSQNRYNYSRALDAMIDELKITL